jgi:hypothetical protein
MEVALVEERYKLVRNRMQGTSLLFDLIEDPGETENLAGEQPAELARMEGALRELLERPR